MQKKKRRGRGGSLILTVAATPKQDKKCSLVLHGSHSSREHMHSYTANAILKVTLHTFTIWAERS